MQMCEESRVDCGMFPGAVKTPSSFTFDKEPFEAVWP